MPLEIGPIVAPPSLGADGTPVPGDVLDPRYHVNAAWPDIEPSAAFRQAEMTPRTPNRRFAIPTPPPPVEPPVPSVIPAWNGKAALLETGLLGTIEAAVQASGDRVRDAWEGASEWERTSEFLTVMAAALGLAVGQIDKLLRDADAIQG